MGYYTNFSLEIISGDDFTIDHEKEISELADYRTCFDGEIKWYHHDEHMRQYSLKHPNTLFKLSGIGEENGDIWHEYYLNGKQQRCQAKIIYDEFDESKLV